MIYIRLFLDYLEAIEPLEDAERGRLFTALLVYARTGDAPPLSGNERFIFPMMRAQVDRDEIDAKSLSETRRAAGKKGAQSANASKTRQNQQMPDLPGKTNKDKEKDKDQDKDKDEDEDKAHDPATAAVWSAYLEKINPQMSERVRVELAGFVDVMGKDCCLRAIDTALDAKKATWPYIKAILQTKQGQGVRCLADWDALEKRRKPDPDPKTGKPSMANIGPADPAQVRADLAGMQRYLAQLRKEETENGECSV